MNSKNDKMKSEVNKFITVVRDFSMTIQSQRTSRYGSMSNMFAKRNQTNRTN